MAARSSTSWSARSGRSGPLLNAAAARTRPRAAGRDSGVDVHRLRRRHSDRAGAVVPGRRGRRAPVSQMDPVERRDHGPPRTTAWCRGPRHISTYASSAALYEVGFNHFFRGKSHPGGGDQLFIQGHASPGIYARAFLEGRLTADQLDGFRQEHSHPGGGLPSYPHPRLMPEFWKFPRCRWAWPAQRDMPSPVQPLPARPRHQGHLQPTRVGVPRRRRNG